MSKVGASGATRKQSREAILKRFAQLLPEDPVTALWLLSLVMAGRSKAAAGQIVARYVKRGPLLRDLSGVAANATGAAAQAGRAGRPQRWAAC
jgi:hypothetical protein